ncbi:MAG: phosphotransferase [Bacteroidales bacterium]|nr:phosphotransferase [Bacteroidales bacterium]
MAQYPQIELDEWTQVGEGYNGQAFVSEAHPGVMLKLVRREMGAAHKVEQEFHAAKTAYEIGLPTPQVYEIVRDGADHGYLCQIVAGKKSFARLCADQPERIPELAARMAEYGHALHATPIAVRDYIPNIKELLLSALAESPLVGWGSWRMTNGGAQSRTPALRGAGHRAHLLSSRPGQPGSCRLPEILDLPDPGDGVKFTRTFILLERPAPETVLSAGRRLPAGRNGRPCHRHRAP